MLSKQFFDRETTEVAKDLLGKVIKHRYSENIWLKAQIIETEAYKKSEKGSHASLGYTKKRKALFMPPGTIYMYYARGDDSFNISTRGEGNAVLIKSGIPYFDKGIDSLSEREKEMLSTMKDINPINGRERETMYLCSGQTLLARSLNLKVKDWDQQEFQRGVLEIVDKNYTPKQVVRTKRLGIPEGRDEELMYRFVDKKYAKYSTDNPLKRNREEGVDYSILPQGAKL
jgi:DNA-3-methyladenine glycosylase